MKDDKTTEDNIEPALDRARDELERRDEMPYDGIAGVLPEDFSEEWQARFHQASNKALDYCGHEDALDFLIAYMRDTEAIYQSEGEFLYTTFIPTEIRTEIEVLALIKRAVEAYNAAPTKRKIAALNILICADTIR